VCLKLMKAVVEKGTRSKAGYFLLAVVQDVEIAEKLATISTQRQSDHDLWKTVKRIRDEWPAVDQWWFYNSVSSEPNYGLSLSFNVAVTKLCVKIAGVYLNVRSLFWKLLKDIYGAYLWGDVPHDISIDIVNFAHPIYPKPMWPTVEMVRANEHRIAKLAQVIFDTKDWSVMPVLADALQEAGCDNVSILSHLRNRPVHWRGCYVLDHLLSLAE
jgi:hypothetical protein